jgi:hypothetical protein
MFSADPITNQRIAWAIFVCFVVGVCWLVHKALGTVEKSDDDDDDSSGWGVG